MSRIQHTSSTHIWYASYITIYIYIVSRDRVNANKPLLFAQSARGWFFFCSTRWDDALFTIISRVAIVYIWNGLLICVCVWNKKNYMCFALCIAECECYGMMMRTPKHMVKRRHRCGEVKYMNWIDVFLQRRGALLPIEKNNEKNARRSASSLCHINLPFIPFFFLATEQPNCMIARSA